VAFVVDRFGPKHGLVIRAAIGDGDDWPWARLDLCRRPRISLSVCGKGQAFSTATLNLPKWPGRCCCDRHRRIAGCVWPNWPIPRCRTILYRRYRSRTEENPHKRTSLLKKEACCNGRVNLGLIAFCRSVDPARRLGCDCVCSGQCWPRSPPSYLRVPPPAPLCQKNVPSARPRSMCSRTPSILIHSYDLSIDTARALALGHIAYRADIHDQDLPCKPKFGSRVCPAVFSPGKRHGLWRVFGDHRQLYCLAPRPCGKICTPEMFASLGYDPTS